MINIVKMSLLPKPKYGFNAIPIKIPIAVFSELTLPILNTYVEPQKTPNSQRILGKYKVGGIMLLKFKLYYKSTIIKTAGTGIKTDLHINGIE